MVVFYSSPPIKSHTVENITLIEDINWPPAKFKLSTDVKKYSNTIISKFFCKTKKKKKKIGGKETYSAIEVTRIG